MTSNIEEKLIATGIKEQSAKIYLSHYNRLIKGAFKNEAPENMISDENVDVITEYLKNGGFSSNTKSMFMRSWKKIAEVNEVKGDYSKIDKKIKEYNDETAYATPTEKEQKNKIDKSYIIKIRDQYKKKLSDTFTSSDTYYLLLCLYTYLPPLRSEDYYNTIIKDDDTDEVNDNFYDLDKKQLILNKYKTMKTHGKRTIDVPDELHDIIKAFHEKSGSNLLICNGAKNKFNAISMNIAFGRCLKKKVSSGMLRKCHISSNIDTGMSAQDRKNEARIMGHTLAVQQLTYSKFSDVLHPDKMDLQYLARRHQQLTEQLNEVNDLIRNLELK